jgi:hypothetical protein
MADQVAQNATGAKLGRPRKAEGRLVPVSTQVPSDLYDAICRLAQRRGVPVAAIVRERLTTAPLVSARPS